MIRACIGLLVVASAASAEIPANVFAKHRYTSPTVVFESATARVATATRAGQARLVLVTADDKLVDGGRVAPGVLTVKQPADIGAPGLVIVALSYVVARPKGVTDTNESLWFVRDNGTPACAVSTNQTTTLGAGCGSSGWTAAEVKVTPDGTSTIVDVRYDRSGHYSTPDAHGGCLQRSPVSSRRMARWIIGPRGLCKEGKPLEDSETF